ncbi:putative protein phosphatase 2C T23F11.1 [Symbiodinium microadriaticum]|uniref:protein-serine/threonine phosphatase n=1 Tax=Symbiodinium microadriaticum TaxID=2951 RepID=A0A1Q9D9Q1_SYMMI|nr:putative protein phosphatase 2C T23F11.1 [Symbiodinium microadriaticum]
MLELALNKQSGRRSSKPIPKVPSDRGYLPKAAPPPASPQVRPVPAEPGPPTTVKAPVLASSPSSLWPKDQNSRLCVYSAGYQGMRPYMEDRACGLLAIPGYPKASVFGVFDGHGGYQVAQMAAERLPRVLVEKLKTGAEPGEAMKDAFCSFDDDLRQNSSTSFQKMGSTAIMTLPLAERQRIEAAGGKANRELPAEQQKVICLPEIREVQINSEDQFFVMASDGVFEVFSSDQLIEELLKERRRLKTWPMAVDSILKHEASAVTKGPLVANPADLPGEEDEDEDDDMEQAGDSELVGDRAGLQPWRAFFFNTAALKHLHWAGDSELVGDRAGLQPWRAFFFNTAALKHLHWVMLAVMWWCASFVAFYDVYYDIPEFTKRGPQLWLLSFGFRLQLWLGVFAVGDWI